MFSHPNRTASDNNVSHLEFGWHRGVAKAEIWLSLAKPVELADLAGQAGSYNLSVL